MTDQNYIFSLISEFQKNKCIHNSTKEIIKNVFIELEKLEQRIIILENTNNKGKGKSKRKTQKRRGSGPALNIIKKKLETDKKRDFKNLIHKIRTFIPAPNVQKQARPILPSTFTTYGPESHYKPPIGRLNPFAIQKITNRSTKKQKKKKKRKKKFTRKNK